MVKETGKFIIKDLEALEEMKMKKKIIKRTRLEAELGSEEEDDSESEDEGALKSKIGDLKKK